LAGARRGVPDRQAAEVLVYKTRNVANCLPKSAQSGAVKAMQEIYNAEDRGHAEKAIEAFAVTCGAKFPRP
jgi:hypothetical protein